MNSVKEDVAEASPTCPNCGTRLRITFVLTLKPTNHAMRPECPLCLDGDAPKAVIKHLLAEAPDRHVRLLNIEAA
jgi:hypothetical protein